MSDLADQLRSFAATNHPEYEADARLHAAAADRIEELTRALRRIEGLMTYARVIKDAAARIDALETALRTAQDNYARAHDVIERIHAELDPDDECHIWCHEVIHATPPREALSDE